MTANKVWGEGAANYWILHLKLEQSCICCGLVLPLVKIGIFLSSDVRLLYDDTNKTKKHKR